MKAEKTISGRVTAVSGEPIVGASVIVKGTSIGNVTGISGEYTISAEPEQTLSFAFLGYNTKEVKVGSRTTIRRHVDGAEQTDLRGGRRGLRTDAQERFHGFDRQREIQRTLG